MAWTVLSYALNSLLTSAKMNQNQDNFTAVAQGLSGAPPITNIGSGGVTNTVTCNADIYMTGLNLNIGTIAIKNDPDFVDHKLHLYQQTAVAADRDMGFYLHPNSGYGTFVAFMANSLNSSDGTGGLRIEVTNSAQQFSIAKRSNDAKYFDFTMVDDARSFEGFHTVINSSYLPRCISSSDTFGINATTVSTRLYSIPYTYVNTTIGVNINATIFKETNSSRHILGANTLDLGASTFAWPLYLYPNFDNFIVVVDNAFGSVNTFSVNYHINYR